MTTGTLPPRTPLPRLRATGTLLGIWAHPDDESYLSAALMASAVAAGERVVVVTATRGEHGTDDPVAWPPERLGTHRARELEAALGVLGVTEHHWLGHTDGTLPDVPLDGAIEPLIGLIEDIRPDTIVTFGPDGATGHADHQVVSSWVTVAWRALGRPGQLWYAAFDDEFHRSWGPLADELGMWMTDRPPDPVPTADLAHQVRPGDALLNQKVAAIRAHASQSTGLIEAVGEATFRSWWSVESFVAAPACPRAERVA